MPGLAADLTDAFAGLALLLGGIAAWRAGSGRLMALAGAVWLAGGVAPAWLYAQRGPLVHLLVTYPEAGRGDPASRGGLTARVGVVALVAFAYVDGLVPALARSAPVTTALCAATVAVVLVRWATARGVTRRSRAAAVAAALPVCATLAFAPSWAYALAVAVTACGLAWDLRTGASITGLVVDLGGEPRALQAALARTLGDPGLRVAYRVDGWVDEAGRPVRLADASAVTYVDGDAAIVHDRSVLADRTLTESASAAVRLVLANVRLRGDVAARGREVAASRRRLLEAADEERRRLGEDLHLGVERRLERIAERLDGLDVPELASALAEARAELRAFARGVHPRTLTEDGLAAALAELAGRSALPVTLRVDAPSCAPSHEAAVYFVCSEALANVAKYAGATHAAITATRSGDRLVVTVADDGVGGADPAGGSGLRGLADRLEALGGTLQLDSPRAAGTRLVAELPLEPRAAERGEAEPPVALGGAR